MKVLSIKFSGFITLNFRFLSDYYKVWILISHRDQTDIFILAAAFKMQLIINRNVKHFLCFAVICLHVLYPFGRLVSSICIWSVKYKRYRLICHSEPPVWKLASEIELHPSNSWHNRHSYFDNLALYSFVITPCSRFTLVCLFVLVIVVLGEFCLFCFVGVFWWVFLVGNFVHFIPPFTETHKILQGLLKNEIMCTIVKKIMASYDCKATLFLWWFECYLPSPTCENHPD